MDAARELASTRAMRHLGSVLVCLGTTSWMVLGCGPEPTAKQPDSVASAANSAGPAPSSTTTDLTTPSATASAGPAPSNSAAATSGDTALVGTLSNAEIQKAINDNMALFDACYTLGANKHGKLEGTVTIKAVVGPLGTIKDIAVVKSTIKNAKVNTCVEDAFRTVKFPQPKGGAVIITYPMTFGGEVVMKK